MAPKKAAAKKDDKGAKDASKAKKEPAADKAAKPAAAEAASSSNGGSAMDPTLIPFEAGSVFAKFDLDGDGKLDKHEFTQLIKQHPNIIQVNRTHRYCWPMQ